MTCKEATACEAISFTGMLGSGPGVVVGLFLADGFSAVQSLSR